MYFQPQYCLDWCILGLIKFSFDNNSDVVLLYINWFVYTLKYIFITFYQVSSSVLIVELYDDVMALHCLSVHFGAFCSCFMSTPAKRISETMIFRRPGVV